MERRKCLRVSLRARARLRSGRPYAEAGRVEWGQSTLSVKLAYPSVLALDDLLLLPLASQDLPSTTSRAFFVSPLQRNSHSQSASPALFDPNGLDYVPPATTPETPPAPTAANNSNGCAPESLITPLPAWLLPWDNDEEGSGSAWHRFAAAVLFAEGSTEGSSLSEEGEGNRWVVVVSPRGEDDEERSIPGEGGEREGGRFRRPGPVELPAFLWTQSALSQDVGVKRVRWRERVCTSISWVEVEGPKEELEIGR